jgi:phage-related tail protein
MAKVGSNIASALTSKNISDLQEAKNQLEELWDSAEKRAKEAEEFLSSVFEDISEDTQDLTSEIEELGSTISDSLVSAVSDGLAEADFMDMMKSYIKNMVVNAVVYTEAIQSEIAAIGEAISNGIKEGFTETGLHEIKRDLSYIFYQANNAISSVDEILSSVFSGYAAGTNNATSGLHIVGEAGPEIVRFRGGEQVLNAQNTQKALSGMGEQTNNFNVTFNNLQDTTAYAMMNQLKQYNREMAINGII